MLAGRVLYSYDNLHRKIEVKQQQSAPNGSGFSTINRENYAYQANNNLNAYTYIESNWNSQDKKQQMYYNDSYSLSDLQIPYSSDEDLLYFNHMLTTMVLYSPSSNQWDMRDSIFYYFSSIPIGIEEIEVPRFKVSPNPTTSYFSIQFEENQECKVVIYDLSGRVIKSLMVECGERISVTDLNSGIYILKIYDLNQKIYSYKLAVY